jgi:hypothetical protein
VGCKTEQRAQVDDTGGRESHSDTEDNWTRTDGRRRKGNEWKEVNAKDSKNSGGADLTVSSLAATRDSYGVTTMLAGCDK